MKLSSSVFCLGLCLSLPVFAARAELIVYEGFAYPGGIENPGDVSSGGSKEGVAPSQGGTGLAAPKLPSGRQPLVVTEEGLSFTDAAGKSLQVSGLAAKAPKNDSAVYPLYTSSGGDPLQRLRDPANPDLFGKPGSALWFSFLMKVEGDITTATQSVLKLGQRHMALGLCNNDRSDAPYLRISGPASKVVAESGQTYLIVGKIEYGESSNASDLNDTVLFWVNPQLGENEPVEPPSAKIEGTNAKLGDFWTETKPEEGDFTSTFDEIRIGETFLEVTPVNP